MFDCREYEMLNKRVEQDVRNQQLLEHEILQEKIVKLQKAREQHKKISEEDKIESYSEYSKNLNDNGVILLSSTSSTSTDKTENSIPAVHYNIRDEEERRTKSATQLIKKHLELEGTHVRTPIRLISNKTVPVNIYGLQLPKSADEKRRQFRTQRRNLKSAGDCGLIGSDMPSFFAAAAGDGALHKQLFELNHFSKVGKNKKVKNAISVVDVE